MMYCGGTHCLVVRFSIAQITTSASRLSHHREIITYRGGFQPPTMSSSVTRFLHAILLAQAGACDLDWALLRFHSVLLHTSRLRS